VPVSKEENWGPFLTLGAWAGICILTLFPYQLLPNETAIKRQAAFFLLYFEKTPALWDMALNTLLFVPFGFALGLWLRKRVSWFSALVATGVASFAFTFSIETLQLYEPTRTSSWYDVATNSMGGLVGFAGSRFCAAGVERALRRGRDWITASARHWKLGAAFAAVVLMGIAGSVWLGRAAMLRNWDASYPLCVGNFPDGRGAWQGEVREIGIASTALGGRDAAKVFEQGFEEAVGSRVVAYYRTGSSAETPDAAGISPPLVWKPAARETAESAAKFEENGPWLESNGPAEKIAEAARRTNQFSLYVNFSSKHMMEAGDHAIVGMCRDEEHCNFLLMHYYTSVVARIRTRITGDAGEISDYHQRMMIQENLTHRILITYDGATMRMYADGKEAGPAMELGAAANFFRHLHALGQYQENGYKTLYYALLFVPVGWILWLEGVKVKSVKGAWWGAALLAPVALEGALTWLCRRPFQAENIGLGIFWAAAAFAFLQFTVPTNEIQSPDAN